MLVLQTKLQETSRFDSLKSFSILQLKFLFLLSFRAFCFIFFELVKFWINHEAVVCADAFDFVLQNYCNCLDEQLSSRNSLWLAIFQVAYIQFDNITLSNVEPDLIYITVWINNSDDKQFGFMGFDSVYLVEYKKIQQRYQIFRRGDNNDYSDLMLNLNTDTCKFLKGMQLNY